MKLVFATHNKHKAQEIQDMLPNNEIHSLEDLKFQREIAETGSTLKANALIKARAIYSEFGTAVIADDTGLEVEALGGRPGVRSARYAGDPGSDSANIQKLLKELKAEKNRRARFRTVLAYIDLSGKEFIFEGEVDGDILEKPSGNRGFGYDPVFRPEGFEITFAEMPPADKNAISHRGRALQKFVDFIQDPVSQKS